MVANKPGSTVTTNQIGATPITSPGYHAYVPIEEYITATNSTGFEAVKFPNGTDVNVNIKTTNLWWGGSLDIHDRVKITWPNATLTVNEYDITVLAHGSDTHAFTFTWPLCRTAIEVWSNITTPGSYFNMTFYTKYFIWGSRREDIAGSNIYKDYNYYYPYTYVNPTPPPPTKAYNDSVPTPDCHVDARDVSGAAAAFGSKPGDAKWWSVADIAHDYKINAKDIAAIARWYGWGGLSAYWLSIEVNSRWMGTTDPEPYGWYVCDIGQIVSVTANPKPGYGLDHWELDHINVGPANPYSVTMNKGHSLKAVFAPLYTLTITATTGGTTDPAPGAHSYLSGTIVPVTATADTGYQFDHWELGTVNVGSANPYSVTMNGNHLLKAVFLPLYTLTVTASAGGTTNPAPGAYSHISGSLVPVSAIPDVGYALDHWELDSVNVGSANPYEVTMDKDHSLRAVFAPGYILTITTTTGGTTDPAPGAHSYVVGSVVPVSAMSEVGYAFDHWELDTVNVGSANPYSVTMDGDHSLKAVFAPGYVLTLTASTGGTTDPLPGIYSYLPGTVVPVTATADGGFQFDHWELDGIDVGSANPYSVTMDKDHVLTALFIPLYKLYISATIGGTTDPAPGEHSYVEGTVVPVTAAADTGYQFDHWELDSENVGSANPYSVAMDYHHGLEAFFVPIHTLTISTTTGGTTDPAPGAHSYVEGTVVPVTAAADTGYQFDHWELDTVNVGSANPYSVTMDGDHSLKAVFLPLYTLTISATTGGTTDPALGAHSYLSGTIVPVTAAADTGYQFDHWELDTVNVGSANPYSVTMDQNHALTAVFVPTP
jgi:hypothetical protein